MSNQLNTTLDEQLRGMAFTVGPRTYARTEPFEAVGHDHSVIFGTHRPSPFGPRWSFTPDFTTSEGDRLARQLEEGAREHPPESSLHPQRLNEPYHTVDDVWRFA